MKLAFINSVWSVMCRDGFPKPTMLYNVPPEYYYQEFMICTTSGSPINRWSPGHYLPGALDGVKFVYAGIGMCGLSHWGEWE